MLRQPVRDPAELDAFVLAEINEVERSLLLQRQLGIKADSSSAIRLSPPSQSRKCSLPN
jgi:hypothetical protein